MENKILKTLKKVNKILSNANITYALGASLCLYFHGIDLDPHDIDIMIMEKDLEIFKKAFSKFNKLETTKLPIYLTKHFYKYEIDGVSLDIMCRFIVKKDDLIYEYPFDESHIKLINYEGETLPICLIDDWEYLYSIMPSRRAKVEMIKKWKENNPLNA